MEETKDQDQEAIEAETQDTSEEQSETTKSEEQDLFELPDGRKVDATTLSKEWKENFMPEFTKRSQTLADFRRERETREAEADKEAEEAMSSSKLLENVEPNVKEAIMQLSLQATKKYIQQRDAANEAKVKDENLKSKFSKAEEAHNGKDGLPKFDKSVVTTFMLESEVYDPEKAYNLMHFDAIIDAKVKNALKGKTTTSRTESTTGKAPDKPKGKTATNWTEASKSAMARF